MIKIEFKDTYQSVRDLLSSFHIHSFPVEEEEEEMNVENEESDRTWWEVFQFETNPCDIRATQYVYGLDDQIKNISNHIRGGNMSCIYGKTGTGKTSTVRYLERSLSKDVFYPILIDGKRYAGLSNINISDGFLNIKRSIIERLLKKTRKKILFIDEFQAVQKYITEQIEAAFNDGEIYALVCVQLDRQMPNVTSSFLNRIGNRFVETNTIDEESCVKLINKRFGEKIPFDDEALHIIIAECEYIPRTVLETIDKILLALHTKQGIQRYKEKKIPRAIVDRLLGKGEIQVNKIEEKIEEVNEDLPIPVGYKLDSAQKEIIIALFRSDKTMTQLQEAVKRSKGSIRGSISKLINKYNNVMRKIKEPGLPLKYALTNEFRRELTKD